MTRPPARSAGVSQAVRNRWSTCVDVEALPERPAGIADEQVGVELARGDDAVAGRGRQADLALVRRAHRVGAVGVADRLDAEIGVGQRVGEQAQLGVVGLPCVDPLQRGPRQGDVAPIGPDSGAALEDVSRRRAAGLLTEGELLAVDEGVRGGAGAGGDREVGGAGGRPGVHPAGRHVGQRRVLEQALDRRQVVVAHLGPREARDGDDEDPVDAGVGTAGIVGVLGPRGPGRPGHDEDDRERQRHGEHGVRPSGQAGHHGLDTRGIRRV